MFPGMLVLRSKDHLALPALISVKARSLIGLNLLRIRPDHCFGNRLAGTKMNCSKTICVGLVCCTALLGVAGVARADDCKEPEIGSNAAPMLSPPLGAVVIGTGRLQFYSAPKLSCVMSGVFVIPKDWLIEYAQTSDGWSSVMYNNPRTNDDVSGWVRTDRLKVTGTMGPKQ